MSFLPADYQPPESSSGGRYMKLVKGENKVRILTDAIVGWVYWSSDGKPVRLKSRPAETPADVRRDDSGKPERIKHFWAMVIWDYKDESIKVFEITQATIQSQISSLYEDEDWGHPRGYDLKIIRSGEGIETEYNVNPGKSGLLPPAMVSVFEQSPINLMALYENSDPFDSKMHSHPIDRMPKPWATYIDMLERASSLEQLEKAAEWAMTKMPKMEEQIGLAFRKASESLAISSQDQSAYDEIPF